MILFRFRCCFQFAPTWLQQGTHSPQRAQVGPKLAPRWPPEGPKRAPREPQEGPKRSPRGAQEGANMVSESLPEAKTTRFPPEGPKTARRGPQTGPREGPRGPQKAPERAPRRLQEGPEELSKGSAGLSRPPLENTPEKRLNSLPSATLPRPWAKGNSNGLHRDVTRYGASGFQRFTSEHTRTTTGSPSFETMDPTTMARWRDWPKASR